MRITENERRMINRGLFVPTSVKNLAKAYFRERLQIHGQSMKAYKETADKFGRCSDWVRRIM